MSTFDIKRVKLHIEKALQKICDLEKTHTTVNKDNIIIVLNHYSDNFWSKEDTNRLVDIIVKRLQSFGYVVISDVDFTERLVNSDYDISVSATITMIVKANLSVVI